MRPTVAATSVVCSAAEHQVTGFRGRQRDPHRFVIAHLADHEDVGRLPDRGPSAVGKSGASTPTSTCSTRPGWLRVLVLDRILDGHDVLRFVPVDGIDQRRERRGLARTGRAANQDEAGAEPGQVLDLGGRFNSDNGGTRLGSIADRGRRPPRS